MRSFKKKPDLRRALYLQLVGAVESGLRQAYAKRHEQGRETQASLAAKLEIDRAAVNRRLSGRTNMTLKSVADMLWALGFRVKIDIFDSESAVGNEHVLQGFEDGNDGAFVRVRPPIPASASDGAARVTKLDFRAHA